MRCVLIILFMAGLFAGCGLKRQYQQEVKTSMRETGKENVTLLSENDIARLPEAVKRYIRYAGCIGKPLVTHFKVCFTGQLRSDSLSPWMNFTSEQYNFMDAPTRLFYMKAVMKGLPVKGFHCYKNGSAFMDIRLLSLFRVQYAKGREMDTAETVTFLNDMCCMAPATLIHKNITWTEIDSLTVKAVFTHKGISIAALLHFNAAGELVKFVSDDRFATMPDKTLKKMRWTTPLKNYKMINGHKLPGYAEAIYTYPSGEFCYGTFYTRNVIYNCAK